MFEVTDGATKSHLVLTWRGVKSQAALLVTWRLIKSNMSSGAPHLPNRLLKLTSRIFANTWIGTILGQEFYICQILY